VQNKDFGMVNSYSNVASECCLPGPIDCIWELFERAGFPDDLLPDSEGWLKSEVTSGYVYGSVGIRNKIGELVAAKLGRNEPYSSQQARNFLDEGNVLAKCDELVAGVPKIAIPEIEKIAWKLVQSKSRRGR